MIEISKLTPSDIGRGVVYEPLNGPREDGVITGWNSRHVFVRYRHRAPFGVSTDPASLEWAPAISNGAMAGP
jgi:hypothetical protein